MRTFRLTLLFSILLLAAQLPNLLAQENPDVPDVMPHPAYHLLDWGSEYFPYPFWAVEINEQNRITFITWRDALFSTVVNYKESYGYEPATGAEIDALVDEEWLDVTAYQGYAEPQVTARCVIGEKLVVEISMFFEEQPYLGRYWVWSDDTLYEAQNTFNEVYAVYPEAAADKLEEFAEHFFADEPRCPAEE